MGCSHETAEQSNSLNTSVDLGYHTNIVSVAIGTGNITTAKNRNNTNNSEKNHKSTQDNTNDNCQQFPKSAATKSKRTQITLTTSHIQQSLVENSNSNSDIFQNNFGRISKLNCIQEREEQNNASLDFCRKCQPLACHYRTCVEDSNISALDTRYSCDISNSSLCKKFHIDTNCICYCHCHRCTLSYFCPEERNTFRYGKQCDQNEILGSGDETGSKTLGPLVSSSRDRHQPKKWLYAKDSLTAAALELKHTFKEAIKGNCASLTETLIRTIIRQSTIKNVNNKNNKSEPYRGYCQSKNTSSESAYIPSYTSTNSCCLHDDIRSTAHPPHQSNRNNNNINTNSKNKNCCSNSNRHNFQSTADSQAAAFNYIGHNYYHFLRNSINFYTASSVILVLCYLTTTTSAATTKSDTTSVDKHPIKGIDWSKFDESSSDKEILDLLLEKKRYDKRLLPPVNGTLTVNVNVLLLSLASPDESSLKYEVEFLLHQQWNDPRLQYGNKSHYDFLNALHHHDSIWTPDTYFIMHGDFKDPIIPMHFALRIFRNGTIMYAMRRHLILSCQGSLHIFPFDDPKCSFSMESISYEEAQIKYVWKNDEDTLRKSPSLTTLNAYLIKNQTTACDQNSWRGNYSCLQVELTFTRDRAYYFTTVFIPGIILVTSSFITFWLEWNAVPARVMIGVTTMLNFFTTSNGFRSTLPVVSNLTAMNVWDGVCMCFIYASLLEFVCVNYMGRKRPQHNVVYRPGENPVTQEIIEREFNAAMSSEKAGSGMSSTGTSVGVTPRPRSPISEQPTSRVHFELEGGIIATAVQNLRARSIKRRISKESSKGWKDSELPTKQTTHVYEHVYAEPGGVTTFSAIPAVRKTGITIETDITDDACEAAPLRRTQSMSTNTPSLIFKGQKDESQKSDAETIEETGGEQTQEPSVRPTRLEMPVRPPRRKSSRSTSPASQPYQALQSAIIEIADSGVESKDTGEKKRDTGGPNEIVACTTCGGNSGSPCTHSANNGCATETCFVQVRKKEPPHPIRIAKTIDVIARITFPTAYAIFLIFFFVHYKGFS